MTSDRDRLKRPTISHAIVLLGQPLPFKKGEPSQLPKPQHEYNAVFGIRNLKCIEVAKYETGGAAGVDQWAILDVTSISSIFRT